LFFLKNKEVEKIIGRKLTFKEKIGFAVLKIHKRLSPKSFNEKYTKDAKKAELFGVLSIVSLFIFPLVTLPLAILAIGYGKKAKKVNPENKRAHTGIVLGWISIGLFVFAILAVLYFISILTI
jgi:heme/copper-type cytochrome/quinol oxidase subunit 2